MFEDEKPQQPQDIVTPINLETLSVEELQQRIADLTAEIERVKQVITQKQAARGAADGVFKL